MNQANGRVHVVELVSSTQHEVFHLRFGVWSFLGHVHVVSCQSAAHAHVRQFVLAVFGLSYEGLLGVKASFVFELDDTMDHSCTRCNHHFRHCVGVASTSLFFVVFFPQFDVGTFFHHHQRTWCCGGHSRRTRFHAPYGTSTHAYGPGSACIFGQVHDQCIAGTCCVESGKEGPTCFGLCVECFQGLFRRSFQKSDVSAFWQIIHPPVIHGWFGTAQFGFPQRFEIGESIAFFRGCIWRGWLGQGFSCRIPRDLQRRSGWDRTCGVEGPLFPTVFVSTPFGRSTSVGWRMGGCRRRDHHSHGVRVVRGCTFASEVVDVVRSVWISIPLPPSQVFPRDPRGVR
mmetsp:Transcript_1196/g.7820  ORF Transcript_1196/g.7820 Transcript_1196/m.7820 type:complete len:342 (+) Transcript_1196:1715-2740(+)